MAEDKEESRSLLVKLLEIAGFDVREAVNGREAVRKARESGPDLMLLDLMMPGMDGDKALQQIRDNLELKDIRVIGVSAEKTTGGSAGKYSPEGRVGRFYGAGENSPGPC